MASSNGIQLPISLQISNLQEVANQIKQFANKNVLADSLGGKKIDSELGKILSRLEQISAKAKTAFTTQGDFTSVQKDINQVELSLNKVQSAIKNLGFDELKIPDEFSGQIAALQGRIRELNSSLATFKGTQKEKLVSNVDFMADLQKADPKQAARWLEKGYDELQKSVNEGMAKVNTTLALRAREFEESQKIITQNNHPGKIATTQLGALSFIQEAFKALPKDDKARNSAQAQMADFMKATADEQGKMEFSGFDKGARGLNSFLKYIADSYKFTPEQMSEIKARLKQQVAELAKEGQKVTQTDVIKAMGHNEGLAKQILFGDKTSDLQAAAAKYASDIKEAQKTLQEKAKLEEQQGAFARLQVHFEIPNKEIAQKAEEIAAALKVPTEALQGFEAQVLSAATSSPQIAALFQKAAGEISTLTNAVEQGKQKLASIDNTINKMQGISNFVNRYVGLYAIVRKVTQAVRNAMANIKDIDKAITSIAVVTNMSQADLWGKIGEYTEMAQQYGVATKDVYTVSQIFYQQGLQTSQVMQMTTESLKMAKIAGIDYSTAANAMTVAVRAFKMEMSEAQQVTDTYSALAAKFAVSSSEIANAMEKTASSAASVGMSLQSTSAFISVMEQTTRESAQNIGSALKSIISRYGEMKASPQKLLNVEGEEVAFNKVDTALSSIGVSIKDASGQFRDFDDVIMELAAKWNSLDNNTQRYIATIMAGNRQQSRFIALVSNYEELNRAMQTANNAENASIVQVAKTMDSLESKANQLKNAFSQIYLDLHFEDTLKGAYDWLTRILKTIGKLGTLKGVLPTLMNVIGVGTGVKKLTGMGMQALQDRKSKLQVETDEAKQKIDEIRAKASEDIKTQWKIEADLSQLEAAKNATQSLATQNMVQMAQTMKANDTHFSLSNFRDVVGIARQNGALLTEEGRSATLEKLGITAENSTEEYRSQLNGFLQAIGQASQQAQQFGQTLDSIKNSSDQASQGMSQVGQSGQQVSTDLNRLSTDTQNASNAENNKGNAAVQAAQEDLNKAAHAREAAREDMNKAQKAAEVAQAEADHATKLQLWDAETLQGKAATKAAEAEAAQKAFEKAQADAAGARAALTKAQADEEGARTERDESQANRESAETERQKKNTGFSGANWGTGNAIKYAGIATGVARLAGTAITAAGAAHQDKSTDTVETSKILTGVGNGLSMAGTGASMLMSLGPWGAAVGAIGGFLLGGLGAIIDGATMTLSERIALKKEEAQKAADESLKIQAKATDMSSQIDNLKQLQKAMYNSTEDMQAYKDAMATMASNYPELISAYDSAGEAIIDITSAEDALSKARLEGATAAREAAIKNLDVVNTQLKAWDQRQVSDVIDQSRLKYLDIVTKTGTSNTQIIQELGKSTLPWFQERANELQGYENNPHNDSIDLTKEIPDSIKEGLITPLEGWFTSNQKELGLKSINEVAFRNDNSGSWTVEQLQRVLSYVEAQEKQLQLKAENLNKIANTSTGLETLLSYLDIDTTIKQSDQSQIETTKNYQGLFNELLTNKLNEKNATLASDKQIKNLYDWQTAENSDYTEQTGEVYSNFIKWYNGLSDSLKEEFASLDFTQYKSTDELIQHFNINSELQDEFIEQYAKANLANKNRILKTIYGEDEGGNALTEGSVNEQLKGINKLGDTNLNKVISLTDHFSGEDGATPIISKYADYFTSQLVAINDLANEGYTELASTRLDVLNQFSTSLASMTSQQQQDMFGIITNVDFSSHDSIQTAIKSMDEYAKKNDIADITKSEQFGPLYEALTSAAETMLFNVNTLAQEVTATITSASDKIDSIIGTNKSGVTFDKALEAFTSLQAQFSELTSLDQVFSYDAVLGKYVYTQNGLTKAIEAQEQKLNDQVTQLTDTAKLYTEQITSTDENGKTSLRIGSSFRFKKGYFKGEQGKEDALKALSVSTGNDKIDAAYQKLAKDYIDSLENIEEASSAGFEQYVIEYAKDAQKAADDALVTINEYNSNKKNQYYQAIDWSKLALGTDFSGSNKQLMQSLAQELEMVKDTGKVDENGKAIFEKYTGTWEEVLNKYLEETYSDESARQVAKTAVEGQIKQQKSQSISTAISEVLQGAGSAISEGTAAILKESEQFDTLINESGVIDAAYDCVDAALTLFETEKEQFTTVAERNKAYIEILNANFASANAGKSLLSNGNKLDLGTLESSFSTLGLNFDELYKKNEETDQFEWTGGFENALTTDIFGETRIKDWDEFVKVLAEHEVDLANASQEEIARWRRAYIDGVIADNDANNLNKSAATQLSNLASAKVGDTINISDVDDSIKSKLGLTGDTYTVVSEAARDAIIAQIDQALINAQDDPTLKATLTQLKDQMSQKRNKSTGYSGIMSSKVSQSTAEVYMTSRGLNPEDTRLIMTENLHFIWDEFAQEYVATEETIQALRDRLALAARDGASDEYINEQTAKINNLEHELQRGKKDNALLDILQNYEQVSEESASAFKTAFGASLQEQGIDISSILKKDITTGTYDVDLNALTNFLTLIGFEMNEAAEEQIAAIADKYVSNIEQASSLVSSGTTSVADMDTFTKSYNEILGLQGDEQKSAADLFNYNEVLGAWTLDPVVLESYVRAQADALVEAGQLDEKDVEKWVKDQTDKLLANNVNIGDFLSAEDKSESGEAYKQLTEQMREYYRSIIGDNSVVDSIINQEISNLKAGGEKAVAEVRLWASRQGRSATSEEIEAAFNAAINDLSEAMDQLAELSVGQITTGKLREYLAKAGKVDSNGVVTSVSDMVDVYQAIYKDMEKTAGRTTAGLNQAYAKVLTAGEQKDIDTLEALENASGMTYEALGDILAKYNIQLKDFMANSSANGIQKAGFGKVKITDWNAFANAVGLSEADMNTPEYMEAYNSWVESRTKFENNEKERVQSAVDELKGLTEATPESAINVSHLEAAMGSGLSAIVEKYGATLNQGMLKLGANTNIPALIQDIADEAARAGKMIPEQLAELADAVQGMLQQITSLIQGGIKGSLSNVDVVKLQNWATQSGLGKLDFQKTADGLKLSEKSAIQLYNKLKDIDGLQAKLVFDDLSESLKASNDNFKDTESLLAHVEKIRNGTYEADNKISDKRKKQYEEELAIAEEILKVRSGQEDDSYKFMDKAIPAGQNNPLNYMQSWGKAYAAMKESTKGGKDTRNRMAYEDFYNLVTEMGHLADITGQAVSLGGKTLANSEEASKLITEAAAHLRVTADGTMKIDLSKIGVNFQAGAKDMNKSVDAGIDAVADAQIAMLDSMIQLLEVVVAMEQLGDIDVNGDNHLNLDEIFQVEGGEAIIDEETQTYKVKEAFKNVCNNIIDMTKDNEELKEALNNVKINGQTMYQIFEDASKGQLQANMKAEEYQQLLDAFYQMAISNDYDLDNLVESVQKMIPQTDQLISIKAQGVTYYMSKDFKYQIKWDKKGTYDNARKALKEMGFEGDLSKNEQVQKAIEDLIKERATNKELKAQDKANIDYTLGLTTGDIQISENKKAKGKDDKFTGTYKGQTFTGATKLEVENKIKQALEYENQGFNFNVENDGSVTGTLNVGGARIKVKKDGEKNQYTAIDSNGNELGTFDSQEEALNELVKHGDGDAGTYTIDGKNYNVFVDSKTNVSYTLLPNNHYMCEGHEFATWEQLQNYLAFKELSKGGEVQKNDEGEEVIVKGKTAVKYDFETNKVTYSWIDPDGNFHDFPNKETYEAYIAAWEKSDGHINTDGDITYEVEGANVSVHYNPDTGELTYTAHLANGKVVTAHDEDSLMFGIAAETEPTGGEVTADGKKTYSYVVNAGNVSVAVSVDENGKVTTTGDGASTLAEQTEAEVKANAEAKLAADQVALETPVNATVNSINVDLADGGIVNAANIGQKIIEAINAYLSANPIDAKILFGVTASPKKGTGEDNSDTNMPNPFADIIDSLNAITTTSIENVQKAIDSLNGIEAIKKINTSLGTIKTTAIDAVAKKLNSLTAKVTTSVSASNASANLTVHVVKSGPGNAAGNIGAFAKGNAALASGTSTLMGELGPELVVSNGRYFVVGQNGAEFVNLQKDAIVFNHKQTERLLAQGGIGSRGIPFTNEQNAISYAKGNVEGPAKGPGDVVEKIDKIYWSGTSGSRSKTFEDLITVKAGGGTSSTSTGSGGGGGGNTNMAQAKGTGSAMASASAALAALKQLRNMWQSLKDMTTKDLSALGGGGGGGGGGAKDAVFLQQLDRWYNYLQKIAILEKQINFEEAKRARIASQYQKDGSKYYASQKESLNKLKEESDRYRDLLADQQAYFEKRRKQVNDSPFKSLYTFDENGQITYGKEAFAAFSKMLGTDQYGRPNYNAQEQYSMIKKLGQKYGINDIENYMQYDSSGNKIEYSGGKPKDEAAYEAAVQAFWDKIEADKNEMQSLTDSINESMTKIEELDTKRNELLQQFRDNQRTVEDKVLKAIEDQRQRAIDALSDERSALEESTGKYIDGLSKALDKEREMYQQNQGEDELNRLMRQLAILQRSGGSASQIRSLQNQIQEKQKESYFDEQQKQIDAIQEASDLQLERLDKQIDIMTETLEYQKEMGLLWDDVYEVMNLSAADITSFIGQDSSTWGDSPLAKDENFQQALFEAQQWKAFQEDIDRIAEGIGTEETHEPNPPDNSEGNYATDVEPDRVPAATPAASKNGTAKATTESRAKVTYKNEKGTKVTRYFSSKKEAEAFAKEQKKNKKNKNVEVTAGTYYIWGKKTKKEKTAKIGPYMSEKLAKADLSNQKKKSKVKRSAWKVAKTKPTGYAEGGYDYETGIAMLHGTAQKPEAIFNATQTQILRDNILSSKPNSLLSLLETYNQAYKDGIGGITNNDSGIIIENATVNMNVSQIANDYDAQRAGEQALTEILRIARKTSSSNSVRR